jgi:hypothetical protein
VDDHEGHEQLNAPQVEAVAKWPTGLLCHQSTPPSAIAKPETIAIPSAANVATPNT